MDYVNWKKKPLEGPKDSVIVPAIESTVRDFEAQLVTVITDQTRSTGRDNPALETTFVRLYTDYMRGDLVTTLERIGISSDDARVNILSSALVTAATSISLPGEVIRLAPNTGRSPLVLDDHGTLPANAL